jgi:hypothetical protein
MPTPNPTTRHFGNSRIELLKSALNSHSTGETLYYPRPNSLEELFELQAILSLEQFKGVTKVIIDSSASDSPRYLTNLFYLNQIRKLASSGKVEFKHQTAKIPPINLSVNQQNGFPKNAISNGREYILNASWNSDGNLREVTIFVVDLLDFGQFHLRITNDHLSELSSQIFDYAFIAIDGLVDEVGIRLWGILRDIEGFIVKKGLEDVFNGSCAGPFEYKSTPMDTPNAFHNQVFSKYVLRLRKEPRK